MPNSTTVRVDVDTRDAVKAIADADGVTLDVAIRRLARAERQRRMGVALAETDADPAWLDVVASELGKDEGR
jgi:antitoxin component of RelBE/YafQ-DinJ toxin-antitoxin module